MGIRNVEPYFPLVPRSSSLSSFDEERGNEMLPLIAANIIF